MHSSVLSDNMEDGQFRKVISSSTGHSSLEMALAQDSAEMNEEQQVTYRTRYRRRLLYANVHTFAHKTSAHGLGRFFSQQIPWLRILWCLVVLGALTGLTMHTYKQISLFRDYPVSSTTRLLTNRFAFPDVTFCDPLMKKFFTMSSQHLYSENILIKNYFALNFILGYSFAETGEKPEDSRVRAMKLAYSGFEHAVHTWPIFNMSRVSARILDMLVYCQYNQEPCSEKNFTVFYHRDYGNCFSFKASNRFMKSSGVEKGLVLVLYSPSVDIIQNNDFYSDTVTTGLETGGLRVVVHQEDTIPYPSEYGINSPSGMQTVLALNQVQTSLANTPTKRCEPRHKFSAFDHVLNQTQAYEKQLADCTTFEHVAGVRATCHCTIEGVLKLNPGEKPERNYCNDILGAQEPERLIHLLGEVLKFLVKDEQLYKYSMVDRGVIKSERYQNASDQNRDLLVELSARLLEAFPSIGGRVTNMKCALPKLKSGRQQSLCLNICNYTTYDFSVFQSRWPDLGFDIRGARIRLARIARMIQGRLDAVNEILKGRNHALNHSIVLHKVDLHQCLEDELNPKENKFHNDTLCKRVHEIVRQSFLQLRVYPKTLTVRQLFEERSYELVNLFSDLGGIMGLWIGVSMVTLCEFAEILLIVVSYYMRSALRKMTRLAEGVTIDQKTEQPQKKPRLRMVAASGGNHCDLRDSPERATNDPARLSLLASSRKLGNHYDHSSNPNVYQQPRLQAATRQWRRRLDFDNSSAGNPWTELQSPLLAATPLPEASMLLPPPPPPQPPQPLPAGGFGHVGCAFSNRFDVGSSDAGGTSADALESPSPLKRPTSPLLLTMPTSGTTSAHQLLRPSGRRRTKRTVGGATSVGGPASAVLYNRETQL